MPSNPRLRRTSKRTCPGVAGKPEGVVVGRAHDLAVDHGLDEPHHLAGAIDRNEVGAELVANPVEIAHGLDALRVEIRAGEIALGRGLEVELEGDQPARVAQEDGLHQLDPPGRPIG